jgi:hypothetical protein
MRGNKKTLSTLAASLLLVTARPAYSISVETNSRGEANTIALADISKQILLKSIELNRFSLQYRLEADKQPKTRIWRYPLSQEVAPSGYITADVIGISQYGSHWSNPEAVSEPSLRSGYITSLIGSSVSGAGSGLEFTATVLRAIENKKKGYDPIGSERRFLTGLKELDVLIDKRDSIASSYSDGDTRQMLFLEGSIIRRLRNYQVAEFLTFHQDMTGYLAYEGAYYLFDVATRALGVSSSICSIRGTYDTRYLGPASILFTLQGAGVMISPLAATFVGYLTKRHNRHRLLRKLNEQICINSTALEDDLQKLQALRKEASPQTMTSVGKLSKRLFLYTIEGYLFQTALDQETKQVRIRNKVAIQSNIFGPLIGSTSIAQGILKMIAYYDYRRPPTTFHKLCVAGHLSYAGSLIGLPGASASLGITGFMLGNSLLHNHKLAKEGHLPKQLLEKRLAYLDELETEVRQMQ